MVIQPLSTRLIKPSFCYSKCNNSLLVDLFDFFCNFTDNLLHLRPFQTNETNNSNKLSWLRTPTSRRYWTSSLCTSAIEKLSQHVYREQIQLMVRGRIELKNTSIKCMCVCVYQEWDPKHSESPPSLLHSYKHKTTTITTTANEDIGTKRDNTFNIFWP